MDLEDDVFGKFFVIIQDKNSKLNYIQDWEEDELEASIRLGLAAAGNPHPL